MRILRIDFTFVCEYELLLMVLRSIPDICLIIYVRDSPHTNIHPLRSIDLPTYVCLHISGEQEEKNAYDEYIHRFYGKINITQQSRRSPRNFR